ncbi:MAG: hypothetical protein Q4F05_06770 [bacterium]|nr:hypothetical protein [bacterium]
MEKQYTELTMELIKALAYGLTDEEAVEDEDMTVEEMKQFRLEYAEEIAERVEELKGAGFID